ncbi:MAG: helicase-related protein, partial [Gaiellaceae bacterium]
RAAPKGRMGDVIQRLRAAIAEGAQAFWICPLVAESEASDLAAAEERADALGRALGPGAVGLVHGQLKPAEKDAAMAAFTEGRTQVLVATTVVEVGVDVPAASIMVIEQAERFGLAQLHQLRGRVGRGAEQSYCLLVSRPTDELSEIAEKRLQALVDTTDGFELAQVDLDLRREGQLLGTRQSGWSDLQFTKLRVDRELIERARELAAELRDEDGPWHDETARLLSATGASALV